MCESLCTLYFCIIRFVILALPLLIGGQEGQPVDKKSCTDNPQRFFLVRHLEDPTYMEWSPEKYSPIKQKPKVLVVELVRFVVVVFNFHSTGCTASFWWWVRVYREGSLWTVLFRIVTLTTENKTHKQQLQTLLGKGRHDDELIEALFVRLS